MSKRHGASAARVAKRAQNPPWFSLPTISFLGQTLLFTHLLLSPLVFWRETADAFEAVKVALLLVAAIVLAALGLSSWIGQPRASWTLSWGGCWRQPLALAVVLHLISAAISTILSISPRTSFFGAFESDAGLVTVLGYTVLFFATRLLCPTVAEARRLLAASVIAAAGVSTYAVVQVAGLDPFPWADYSVVGSVARPFATLGHPNLMAAFLVTTFPLSAEFARQSAQKRQWPALGLVLLIGAGSLAAIVASLSRGAWLGGTAMLVVLAMGWRRDRSRRAGAWLMPPILAALVIGAVVVAANPAWRESFGERILHLTDSAGRSCIWKAALGIFQEHPLCGCGLDTFQLAFPHHRTVAYWGIEWNGTPAKAHNEVLHVLATQGLLGGLALLVLAVGVMRTGLRAYRQAPSDQKPCVLAMLAGVAGFFVQDMVGFSVVGCGTLVVTLLAVLSRFGECSPAGVKPPASGKRSLALVRPVQVGIWAAAVVLVFQGVIRPLQAGRACRGRDLVLESEPLQAVARLEQAVSAVPGNDLYWAKLGKACQIAVKTQPEPRETQVLLEKARLAFERALALVPVNSIHHVNLGLVLAEQARLGLARADEVFAHFDLALAADPNNGNYYADAGNAALALGQTERVRFYARQGLDRYPDFGPLRALRAYLALLERQPQDARALFLDAFSGDWHGDERGCAFAKSVFGSTLVPDRDRDPQSVPLLESK
jgi:O-antigen ligase